MKSDEIVIRDKRTNIRVVEVKSEENEKILGLFDDDTYREDASFFIRTNNSSFETNPTNCLILSLLLTAASPYWQFGQTKSRF